MATTLEVASRFGQSLCEHALMTPDAEQRLTPTPKHPEASLGPHDWREALHQILEAERSGDTWPRVAVVELDQARETARAVISVGFEPEHGVPDHPLENSLSCEVYQTGEPLVLEDIIHDQGYSPGSARIVLAAIEHGYMSAVLVPATLGEHACVVWFCDTRARQLDPHDLAYARLLVRQLVLAVEAADLRHEQMDARSTIQQLTDLVDQQRATIDRLGHDQTQLARLAAEDAGLDLVTDTIGDLLGNPVLLLDEMLQAVCVHDVLPDLDMPPWPDRPASLPEWAEDLAGRLRALPLPTRQAILEPGQEDGVTERLLVTAVIVGRDLLGYICVREVQRPIDQIDLLIVQQAATVVATGLLKERMSFGLRGHIRSDVLAELLSARALTDQQLQRHARTLGLDLAEGGHLVLIRPPVMAYGTDALLDRLGTVTRLIATDRLEQSQVIRQRGDLVVLTCVDGKTAAAQLDEELRRRMPECSVLIAVGRQWQGREGLRKAYLEAGRLADAALALHLDVTVVQPDDLGVVGLLTRQETADDLIGFAEHRLQALVEYDESHNTELLRTLASYVNHSGHLQHTADELFIHISTLRYRLDKLQALTGCDLKDAEQRFELQLAMKIRDVVGERRDA